jgi:hypothetical protein
LSVQDISRCGVEWAEIPVVKAMKLNTVKNASVAKAAGLQKYVGRRVFEVNSQRIKRPSDMDRMVRSVQARELDQADSQATNHAMMLFSFKSRESVMQASTDILGPTNASFLEAAMGCLVWWAFGEHMQEVVSASYPKPLMQALVIALLALAFTLCSVAIFVSNRLPWLRYVEKLHAQETAEQRTTQDLEAAAEEESIQEHHAIHHFEDEEKEVGPMMPGAAGGAMMAKHRRKINFDGAWAAWPLDSRVRELRQALSSWTPTESGNALTSQEVSVSARREWYVQVGKWAQRCTDELN